MVMQTSPNISLSHNLKGLTMKNFLECLFVCSIALLIATLAQIDYIPTQDEKDLVNLCLGVASVAFFGLLIRAYCFKVGGITFFRFGRLFCSFGISK